MKKNVILVVALIALMTGVLSAQTYDSESDFEVTKSGNAVTITKYVGKKTAVSIPPSIQNTPVTVIGEAAFSRNGILKSVSIPNSVTSIGTSAFNGCTSLDSVTIHNSVTRIGQMAFQACILLKNVTIGSGVTSIAMLAFQNCPITSVTFQGTIASVNFDNNAFDGDLRAKYVAGGIGTYTRPNSGSTTWTKTPTATAAPSGDSESDFKVTKTGNAITIIEYVGSKTVVNIPPSIQNTPVTAIGENAFYRASITSVIIPNTVTSIETGAFSYCTSLTSVTIPASVKNIGNIAFTNCTSLTSVTFQGTIAEANFKDRDPFPYDLRDVFYATNETNGTPGTYTRPNGTTRKWTRK